jgi:predicted DCC family thiol-disulfide oxidoreductase YuxK
MPDRWLLLYDGACHLCRRSLQAVRRLDRAGRVEAVTFDEARRRGLMEGLGEDAFHLRAPDGRTWRGGDAVPVLAELLGLPAWPWRSAAARALTRRAYGWVARHRGALGRFLP